MDLWNLFTYYLPIVLNIIFLIWWRTNCKWEFDNTKFPTKGHIVILSLLGLIPIWGLIQLIVLVIVYGAHRLTGDIVLKDTKFNRRWFDVDEED